MLRRGAESNGRHTRPTIALFRRSRPPCGVFSSRTRSTAPTTVSSPRGRATSSGNASFSPAATYPAVLNTTSAHPHAALACANAASISAVLVMSSWMTRRRSAGYSCARPASDEGLRSVATTLSPLSSAWMTVSRSKSEKEPVTARNDRVRGTSVWKRLQSDAFPTAGQRFVGAESEDG